LRFFEPKRLHPVLLIDRCEDAELLLLLLLIVVGLLMVVEGLAECTRARVYWGGDAEVGAVANGEVMMGTIVISDLDTDIEGLEDDRPEEVCGRCGWDVEDSVADDGGAENDAGRAEADTERVAVGRGPGLQAKGEMDFEYGVQVMAGIVKAVVLYSGAYMSDERWRSSGLDVLDHNKVAT
jgi:hypothetical protein